MKEIEKLEFVEELSNKSVENIVRNHCSGDSDLRENKISIMDAKNAIYAEFNRIASKFFEKNVFKEVLEG